MSKLKTLMIGQESAPCREETFTKDVQHYRIIHFKSPFQFNMIQEVDNRKSFVMTSLFEKLQWLMKDEETKSGEFTIRLHKLKIYVALDKPTRTWHRVRLMRVNRKWGTALIYYFDSLLQFEVIPLGDLRALPQEMTDAVLVPVYRAYLYDVIPVDGSYNWSEEALKYFETQIRHFPVWVGLQMTWNVQRVMQGPDQLIDVGMVLFQDNEDIKRSLNWAIVMQGCGKAIGIGATNVADLYSREWEPVFSLVGLPPFPKVDYLNGKVPGFAGNRWPQVVIRRIAGPGCIYVSLMSKMEEFRAMKKKLEEIFNNGGPNVDKEDLKIGYRCLYVQNDYSYQTDDDIHRSVVIKINGPESVDVLLVDEGRSLTTDLSALYIIPRRVKDIPAFVHRVHLKSIRPVDAVAGFAQWSESVNEEFNKLIQRMKDVRNKTVWFAVRSDSRNSEDMVVFRDIDRVPVFHQETGKWGSLNVGEYHYDEYSDVSMAHSHIVSCGMDILFIRQNYKELDKELKWNFESLSEVVAADPNRFHATFVSDRMDKKKYYEGLLATK